MIKWFTDIEIDYLKKKINNSVLSDNDIQWIEDGVFYKVRNLMYHRNEMEVSFFYNEDKELKTVTLIEWIDTIQNGPRWNDYASKN